jgi:hypothetical protein
MAALHDRALIGVMVYAFARVAAMISVNVGFRSAKLCAIGIRNLSLCPSSCLLDRPPDVGSALRRTRISREIIVLESTFHLILRHAVSECRDAECDVRSSGSVLVFARIAEVFERQSR